jgi:predicted DCC family thiol-disulfide oxidoreductase YuxK
MTHDGSRAPMPAAADGRSRPIVFYDGTCGLCHRSVSFLLDHDPAGALRFARLEGDLARQLLAPEDRDVGEGGSVVLFEPAAGGRVSRRSEAVLRALGYLPAPWRPLAALAGVRLLRPALDAGYRFVARRRERWFGRAEACPLPDPLLRERFLD